jgi:hypothetical protein
MDFDDKKRAKSAGRKRNEFENYSETEFIPASKTVNQRQKLTF